MASITIVLNPPNITGKDLIAAQNIVTNQIGNTIDHTFPGHSLMFCFFVVFPILVLWSFLSTKHQEKKRKEEYASRRTINRYTFQGRHPK